MRSKDLSVEKRCLIRDDHHPGPQIDHIADSLSPRRYTGAMTVQTRKILDEIKDYFAEQPDIRLGIVFGSFASGLVNRDSDLDIAVLGDRPLSAERCMTLIEALARLTGRAVDLVDLRTAGVAIARSAVIGGRVVFSRDAAAYPAQVSRMLLDSADFLPYRERMLRARRESWIR